MPLKTRHKIHISTASVVILGIIVLLILGYQKVGNFVDALQKLVNAQTNGAYTLVIGDADFAFRKLTIALTDVEIRKTGESESGIESVRVPRAFADLGSLKSLLAVRQLDIQNIIVEDPYVVVQSKNNEQTDQANITNQLLKLFKPIESLLQTFYVQSLTIRQGGIDIKKEESDELKLGLINLFVNDWNMRQLTANSSIAVELSKQKLIFKNMTAAFDAVEYRYPQHYLKFSNVELVAQDSILSSRMTSKSILISGLDYEELYYHGKYKLRKVEFDEPAIHSRIGQNRKKTDPGIILKTFHGLFGEFQLDSALFYHGKIDVTITGQNDIQHLTVGAFDLMLAGLFTFDPTNLMLGDMEFASGNVVLDSEGGDDITVDSIRLDRAGNLTLNNFNLKGLGKQISVARFSASQIDLPLFYKENTLKTNGIVVTNPVVVMHTARRPEAASMGALPANLNVSVSRTTVDNATVEIIQPTLGAKFTGISARLGRLTSLSPPAIQASLQSASIGNVSMRLPDNLLVSGASWSVLPDLFKARSVIVTHDSLKFGVTDLHVEQQDLLKIEPGSLAFDSIRLGQLDILGKLPEGLKKSDNNVMPVRLRKLVLSKLYSNLKANDKIISATGRDLIAEHVTLGDSVGYSSVTGTLGNIQYRDANAQASLRSLQLVTNGYSTFQGLKAETGELQLAVESGQVTPLVLTRGSGTTQHVRLSNISIQNPESMSLQLDSAVLGEIRIPIAENSPLARQAHLYRPVVALKRHGQPQTKKKSALNLHEIPELFIHEGEIDLDGRPVRFQTLNAKLAGDKPYIHGKSFAFETPHLSLNLASLDIIKSKAVLKNFEMKPAPGAPKREVQKDVISVGVGTILLTDIDIARLTAGDVNADSLALSDIILQIEKDKRLPLPPPEEKPLLLRSLIPKSFQFNRGSITNMRLNYTEVSAKTGQMGTIQLNDIRANMRFNETRGADTFDPLQLEAYASIYEGQIRLGYTETTPSRFDLDVSVSGLDLTELNEITRPLVAVEIKKGNLYSMSMQAIADLDTARANARMTYDKLHVQIYKRDNPEQITVGSQLKTILAEGIIIRHAREDGEVTIHQPRLREKSIFNYWVKTTANSMMSVVRHGKKRRARKR